MYLLRSFQKTLPYICKVWNSDNGSCYLCYFCVKVEALYGSEVKKLSWIKKKINFLITFHFGAWWWLPWISHHVALSCHFRNRLHWKKQHPVRQKSHKYAPTLTTETSTVTWLALQLQKMLHIHLRPTGLMAVVSVEAGLQKWNTLLCVILFGHCVGCFLSQCRWPTRGTLAP